MSEQHLSRKHETISKKYQYHSSAPGSTSNVAIAHRPSQAFKVRTTAPTMHSTARHSTMTLQEEKDCMPAITLTKYNHEPQDHTTIPSLSYLIKPTSNDSSTSSTSSYLANNKRTTYSTSHTDHSIKTPPNTSVDMPTLRVELEVHFQRLKSEFEHKTGRIWAPLRAWEKEAWEWNDGEAEKEDMFDLN
jgi:hypothetical protein